MHIELKCEKNKRYTKLTEILQQLSLHALK